MLRASAALRGGRLAIAAQTERPSARRSEAMAGTLISSLPGKRPVSGRQPVGLRPATPQGSLIPLVIERVTGSVLTTAPFGPALATVSTARIKLLVRPCTPSFRAKQEQLRQGQARTTSRHIVPAPEPSSETVPRQVRQPRQTLQPPAGRRSGAPLLLRASASTMPKLLRPPTLARPLARQRKRWRRARHRRPERPVVTRPVKRRPATCPLGVRQT